MSDEKLKKDLNTNIVEKLHENQLYREAIRLAPADEKEKIANTAEKFVVQFFSIVNLAHRKIQEEKEKEASLINKNSSDK